MAAEQLQIQVSANVSNAVKGLNDLEKGLKSTETAGVKLGSQGLPQVTKGANQANTAMINLSRTVSDAPFGFIGIANNIGPLVENFVSLKREAGTTGGALKQLGASLAGPGGLIVGIQLVVAAVQFAQLGFSRWSASSKKTKEEQDKLKQSTDQLVTTISKQKLEVESLVSVARNATLAENDRALAIKRLNDIIPDNIGKLNLQNIATAEGTQVIREYIKAVEAKATAELISNRIAENNIKLFDNRNAALKATENFEKQINDLRDKQNKLYQQGRFEASEQLGIQIKNLQALSKANQSQNIFRKTAKEILADNAALRAEYERLLPTFNKLGKEQQAAKEGEKSLQEQIDDLIKKYKQEIAGINWDQVNRGIDGTNKRLDTALDALKEITLKGVNPTSESFRFLTSEVEKFRSALDYKNFRENLQKINEDVKAQGAARKQLNNELKSSLDNATRLISSQIKTEKALSDFRLKEFEKQIELQKQLQSTIEGGLTNAFTSVFEAIANGEDAFKALGDSVKQLALDLIRVVIQMTVVKALANALMPGLGGAGVGAAQDLLKVRGDFLVRSLSRAF